MRHKKKCKKLYFAAELLFCAVCMFACQSENASALALDNMVEKALDTDEDTFFETFGVNKGYSEYSDEYGTDMYTLRERALIGGEQASVFAQFQDGQWIGTVYEVYFEGEDYLQEAYNCLYTCDRDFSRIYGEPFRMMEGEKTFLERAPDFETFEAIFGGEMIWTGDQYHFGDELVVTMDLMADDSGDDSAGRVMVRVYRYVYRGIGPAS